MKLSIDSLKRLKKDELIDHILELYEKVPDETKSNHTFENVLNPKVTLRVKSDLINQSKMYKIYCGEENKEVAYNIKLTIISDSQIRFQIDKHKDIYTLSQLQIFMLNEAGFTRSFLLNLLESNLKIECLSFKIA